MTTKNKELAVEIMPDGDLVLVWTDAEGRFTKIRQSLNTKIYKRYNLKMKSWLLHLGFSDITISVSPSISFFRKFTKLFLEKVRRITELENGIDKLSVDVDKSEIGQLLLDAPLMTGVECLNGHLLKNLWKSLNDLLSAEIKQFNGTAEEYFKEVDQSIHLVGKVFFHLVENRQNEDYPFAFLATYSSRLGKTGESKHIPLKYALREYENDEKKLLDLLSTVSIASKESNLIKEILDSGDIFSPLVWDTDDALSFLKDVEIIERSGVLCRIPDFWKTNKASSRLKISVGESQTSMMNMDALLDFKAEIYLGDNSFSIEDAKNLLLQTEGLALIKNKWVHVDIEKLKETISAYEDASSLMKDGLSFRDALKFQLTPEDQMSMDHKDTYDEIEVSNGKWLNSIFEKLKNPGKLNNVKPTREFKANLRNYQKDGLNWLTFLNSLGLGACLADDMGLGKTVQLLAYLNVLKKEKPDSLSLLIIPASLISNWVSEIEKFYPTISVIIAHQSASKKNVTEKPDMLRTDLIITTYAMADRTKWLHDIHWTTLVLDEAQVIKNPGAKQTKAVKKLKAKNRIIMTGTPIENKLSDLWSLFDFLNPGILGTSKEFRVFSKKLAKENQGYSKLRNIISPFILRRMKSDKSIISDLPDKVEMKTYATLTKKQTVLYEEKVHDIQRVLDTETGIKRKGLILSSIMKFKQLCNHPDQYLGTGAFSEDESGKFKRLREICETIHEKRERVLIFTQFKEMTKCLDSFLLEIFGKKGSVLHGSVPVKKRKEIIQEFQNGPTIPYMVLSLKAGGVGLNLTRANHIIHFDRWWNPAVENQATDRAFRIGQKKNVMVHKFITQGTIEEKIDNMIDEKIKLSRDVIADSGEKWITEMETDELMELFSLTK